MFTKAKIFNLALGALLLQRQIANTETDTSNEGKVLQTHWDMALHATLEDLDLDSTSCQKTLELVATFDPANDDPVVSQWYYAYKYPSNCAFFRRVQSAVLMDNRTTHIPKRIGMYGSQKVIFTNEASAIGEYIQSDFPFSSLSASAAMALAHRLARLSAPLITGKGAQRLVLDIEKNYAVWKAQAQARDERENFNFVEDSVQSEFVEARLE